jgi:hypothetical protein
MTIIGPLSRGLEEIRTWFLRNEAVLIPELTVLAHSKL